MTDSNAQQLLAFSDEGDPAGSVVVMGSSLGTTRAMWDRQIPALGHQFRMIRFDHLGHGESPVPDGPYTLEQLGNGVLRLMDSLNIEKASYVGLSMGGILGMWLGINAPERIDRLVLMCTAANFPTEESWRERAGLVRANGVEAVSGAVLERWFTERMRNEQPDVLAPYAAMVAGTPAEGYAGSCEALATADLREDIRSITAPTLAIAGADDPSTPPDKLRLIAERIPGAQLQIIAQAAHLANVEQAETVNALLITHLAGSGT